ncbi:MAG: acyl carrier protein [Acidimicrobiia bacterium]
MTDLTNDLLTLVAEEISATGEPVEPDTDLLLSGMVDSLGVVRIVHWLEERCGFTVDPADVTLEHFQTVAAIVGYAQRRQGAAA